jgi:hypothetical protein
MRIYACTMPVDSELKHSKVEVFSKSKSLFSKDSHIPSFPREIVEFFEESRLNGRFCKPFGEIIASSDIKIALSKQRRFKKSTMPDLTWYQYQDLIIASGDFKSIVDPFINDSVEWIYLGTLQRKTYYFMNFVLYYETFNFLESKYITFSEYSWGMSTELIRKDIGFKEEDFNDLKTPNVFFSINDYVFNIDEVKKCPIFLLPYATFGRESLYFSDEIINLIKTNNLSVEGSLSLAYSRV